MKTFCILTCTAAALMLSAASASAGMGGGGGDTTRPSYDMPRAYDRDAQGNETYYPSNTWFGPRYYYDDEDRPVRKPKKKVMKKKHYDD